MQFKLMTYNIHRGVSFGGRPIVPRMVRALEQINFDVLCLQEVWFPESFSQCGLESIFGEGSYWCCRELKLGATGRQANAIVSRFPIINEEFYDLSQSGYENRGLLLATLKLPEGQELHIGSLHLGLSHNERSVQMDKLEEILEREYGAKFPFILAGDFNDWRSHFMDAKFLSSHFKEAFLDGHGYYAKSFPSVFPFLPLDRIYFKDCGLMGAEVFRGKPWSRLSDHLPLIADFVV